jgi:hypothetical protein
VVAGIAAVRADERSRNGDNVLDRPFTTMGVTMNRLLALGVVGWVAFGALGACQGPDPFDRASDAGGIHGLGGHGTGGVRGVGGNFAGVGGHGVGGTIGGVGGNIAGIGGHGVGGATGTGGMPSDGGIGTGGRGTGGRSGDAGANCITAIISNGYAAPPAAPCSACKDNNNNSWETNCKAMLDCMALKPQPVNASDEQMCFNMASGSGTLQSTCVDPLLAAGGCQ